MQRDGGQNQRAQSRVGCKSRWTTTRWCVDGIVSRFLKSGAFALVHEPDVCVSMSGSTGAHVYQIYDSCQYFVRVDSILLAASRHLSCVVCDQTEDVYT